MCHSHGDNDSSVTLTGTRDHLSSSLFQLDTRFPMLSALRASNVGSHWALRSAQQTSRAIGALSTSLTNSQLSTSAFTAQRRSMASVSPDGDMPNVASSKFLRPTREAALKSPGIKWEDTNDIAGHGSSGSGALDMETRKMNMYQAIRDAMRCAAHLYSSCLYLRRVLIQFGRLSSIALGEDDSAVVFGEVRLIRTRDISHYH